MSEEIERIRTQLRVSQFLTVALTVAVGLLVYRLDQFQKRSIEAQSTGVQKLLEDISRMNKSVFELQRYGATHPDYLPILKKYGLEAMTGTNASGVALPVVVPKSPATVTNAPRR